MNVIAAHSPDNLATVRELFREYAASLDIDLCFQNFEQELAELPGKYAPPSGGLFLAMADGQAAGCAAVRAMEGDVCEMKRLYVRPQYRGRGAGRMLALATISAAREIGYRRIVLDTLDSLHAALALYERLGFRRIKPYYHNPSSSAVFLGLELLES
jgi:putative acetyltransferase